MKGTLVNMRCKICTNINLKFPIVATVGLHKAIKLLDEDATSVEASASFSVCGHTSNTSGKLKFSTSLFTDHIVICMVYLQSIIQYVLQFV